MEGVSSRAGCVLQALTQLENLASFYHIYHFAIYGHRELLAARPGPDGGLAEGAPAGQVGGPRLQGGGGGGVGY